MLFVTEGAVSKWERGVSYPDITLISDICRVLDITEHELITASIDTDTRKMKHDWFFVVLATFLFGPSSNSSYQVDFQNWEQCLNGNVQFIVLLLFLLVGTIFSTIGFFRVIRNNKR